ncbi:hypothetical protein VTJ83DRAFT_6408 [Remersonia thermophila]|uniref:Geranylgeranyl transferase type-2 subunit alpha n=1 Tax=Remersonia thermophila TaxID=72144 RepID=A0ABR4D4M5_9PEZI
MADQGGYSQHGIARTSRVRTEEQRQRDLDRIAKYRNLEDQVRQRVAASDYSPETFRLTSALLKLNPEYYTIWNARRRCLISSSFSKQPSGSSHSKASSNTFPTATTRGSSTASSSAPSATTPPSQASPTAGTSGTTAEEATHNDRSDAESEAHDFSIIRSELTFTIPLLLESPKCYWIWSYRLWILQQAISRLPAARARAVWEEELRLASRMLDKDRRNFHAWGYRRHVVAQLESPVLNGKSMAEAEFAYTTAMIHKDLSNFSAWHSRAKLIPCLLDERGADDAARRAFLDAELNQTREALNVGPEDQSLWYYHQYLILNIVRPSQHPAMAPHFSTTDRIAYLERELDEVRSLLEDYDDVQLVYEALFEYTLFLCELRRGNAKEGKIGEEEKKDLVEWLGRLKGLDPMRRGRWADLERELGLEEGPGSR